MVTMTARAKARLKEIRAEQAKVNADIKAGRIKPGDDRRASIRRQQQTALALAASKVPMSDADRAKLAAGFQRAKSLGVPVRELARQGVGAAAAGLTPVPGRPGAFVPPGSTLLRERARLGAWQGHNSR